MRWRMTNVREIFRQNSFAKCVLSLFQMERKIVWSITKSESFPQPLNQQLNTQLLRQQSVRKFQNPIKSFIQVNGVVQIWIEMLPLFGIWSFSNGINLMHFYHYRVEESFVRMSGSFGQSTLIVVARFRIEKCELVLRKT